ncbi:hypothetical protein TeGR_g10867 [Tetraparma gracilis]|uniref:Uncharacterized protein n=1 Tax=Tetraparma gracilis TaxID=2962635 RepID=A0ABQ6MNE8_9STRA|nr:hypothetical protein TeGR_g10867 [Tetraparma gracilis]
MSLQPPPSAAPAAPAPLSLSAPSNLIKGGLKAAQASLASNPILGSLISKQESGLHPDDAAIHRSVGVDPDYYDMVDDDIISVILNACKPLFDLVQGTDTDDPDSGHDSSASGMKNADLVMNTAKLIIAAGYKMKEQARQEMAEEDLGGGMFDEAVKRVRAYAVKVSQPQNYEADEQQILDEQFAIHKAPNKSLRKYKTGTKLFSCDVADTGSGVDVLVRGEVRAPPEQVLATLMGHTNVYDRYRHKTGGNIAEIGERRNDHSVVSRSPVPMPQPLQDREMVVRSMWKKLDEDTFFYSQTVYDHEDFPERPDVVRMGYRRSMKLTRIGPKLTMFEGRASLDLRGSIPRRINDSVTIPLIAKVAAGYARYFACVRPADAFDEGDGTTLGRLLYL